MLNIWILPPIPSPSFELTLAVNCELTSVHKQKYRNNWPWLVNFLKLSYLMMSPSLTSSIFSCAGSRKPSWYKFTEFLLNSNFLWIKCSKSATIRQDAVSKRNHVFLLYPGTSSSKDRRTRIDIVRRVLKVIWVRKYNFLSGTLQKARLAYFPPWHSMSHVLSNNDYDRTS